MIFTDDNSGIGKRIIVLLTIRLEGNIGMLLVGAKAALPPAKQKSSAFPADSTKYPGCSAADPRHSLEEVGGRLDGEAELRRSSAGKA